MGTNYYAHINKCKSCGRFDEHHIGKASSGWQFLLTPFRKSWREWIAFLLSDGVEIFDEYGKKVPDNKEFIEYVDNKQDSKNNWQLGDDPSKYEDYDSEGYRISKTSDFS